MGQSSITRVTPRPSEPVPIIIWCERCAWKASHAACCTEDLTQEAIAFLRKLLEIHEHEAHRPSL